MQIEELVQSVEEELNEESLKEARKLLKIKLQELRAAKVVVSNIEREYATLLEEIVSGIY